MKEKRPGFLGEEEDKVFISISNGGLNTVRTLLSSNWLNRRRWLAHLRFPNDQWIHAIWQTQQTSILLTWWPWHAWADFQLITLTHFAELLWTELNMNYCILLWNLIKTETSYAMHEWSNRVMTQNLIVLLWNNSITMIVLYVRFSDSCMLVV